MPHFGYAPAGLTRKPLELQHGRGSWRWEQSELEPWEPAPCCAASPSALSGEGGRHSCFLAMVTSGDFAQRCHAGQVATVGLLSQSCTCSRELSSALPQGSCVYLLGGGHALLGSPRLCWSGRRSGRVSSFMVACSLRDIVWFCVVNTGGLFGLQARRLVPVQFSGPPSLCLPIWGPSLHT